MTLTATVLSKPQCGPCTWVKKSLDQHGVEYIERDVTVDTAAEQLLRDLYAARRPGQHPSTPVTLLSSEQGVLTIFGPDIRGHLRELTRAADASTAA
ncbi:glutaredoxin [Mycobacteroides abscessus subsp. abscessus]|uniref:glutaredoxin family protein n=1 Tax=Mycobacteroides abscessus TaxID=36809 RepID=UPI00092AA955|nr:glutaredoxin family protein [Mycobacteroides abscessus]SHP29115.1 glutaredoxin [Mycobacteroides abscessus subsp. abscessus]SHP69428.1 glutaredoxin [Mycobacteroides abscessus subsp. abscessus]SHY39550.1 glutaredoxin [Mycobacteroides abscessus subsp. abscessus]SKD93121.1 glutaredoxin [Mycobacteroides abscessus subsp. abscessus]